MAARVDVQVVLYGTRPPVINRLTQAVSATARHAREVGAADEVSLRLGDCSPGPVIGRDETRSLAAEALAEGLSDLTYEHFGTNVGHGGGHNRLARASTGDVLVVLDADAYTAPPLLVRLLEALDRPDVGIAEARRIPVEHPKDHDPLTGETPWATRCCLALRRTTFETVGGFDDASFFLHGDDVDLSWRVRVLGLGVVHVPSAVVFQGGPIGGEQTPLGGEVTAARRTEEEYETLLASLLLAWKAKRPDVVFQRLQWVDEQGGAPHRRAAAEYRRREAAGILPPPYPETESLAPFVDGAFALGRF